MDLKGQSWAQNQELEQTDEAAQRSGWRTALFGIHRCRVIQISAGEGRTTSSASDGGVQRGAGEKWVQSKYASPTPPPDSLHLTALCLICTSILSLTLKSRSLNQVLNVPLCN